MNIMSFHELSKYSISTVILECSSYLVPYYLSKFLVNVEPEEGGLDNIPMKMKINSVNLNHIDSLRTCKSEFHPVATHETKLSFQYMCMKLIYLILL